MGSSRNSSSSELPGRVAAVLAPEIFPGAHLALGLSGGLDSVVLLSILLGLAPALRFSLRAVHAVSRAEIETHARLHGLEWVEDESNADTSRRRNFLRLDVFPLLERQFPGARATIARAAAHLAEARELLDEMARTDFERCAGTEGVNVGDLQRLGEARAKNLLRYWCETKNIEPLSAARTGELLRQLRESRADARIGFAVPGWTFLRYRERLYLRRAPETIGRNLCEVWDGANALPMLSLGGVLKFKPEEGRGLSFAKLHARRGTARLPHRGA